MKNLTAIFFAATSILANFHSFGQNDTAINIEGRIITLSEVVVSNKLDVPEFINLVKSDTSFYKAFKNLRILGFTALNDIRMNDRSDKLKASLRSKTRQVRNASCRTMEVLEEKTTGDIYDKNKNFNYYTASMYASLFFTNGKICGENNIVAGNEFSTKGKKGMEKHKEQLKMLFFDPGRKIKGLPFISNKTAIYSESMIEDYDMRISNELFNNQECYVFHQKVKPGHKNNVVINEMTTWFNEKTFDVVGRNYSLSYDAGVYDFEVSMEVVMDQFNGLTVPKLIRYVGDWKVVSKKRERGIFTATLFDFNTGQ